MKRLNIKLIALVAITFFIMVGAINGQKNPLKIGVVGLTDGLLVPAAITGHIDEEVSILVSFGSVGFD
mgnify:CR=1 FL=1